MQDLGVIDQFTNVFSQYIDTGFGLLSGEVRYLTVTLIVIDLTLAGLFWAMNPAEDVIARFIRKTLYIGTFAFILANFNPLATIILRSFAGLGLLASGSPLAPGDLLRPGRLAAAGVDAGRPILHQIGDLSGFPDLFTNFDSIAVLLIAWLIVIVSFFVLAVQLFVTLIEFKLTTLAGFVLIPFALWNKTAFLAERVLGNVVASGIKVLVLAVIVGIGTTLFAGFVTPPGQTLSIDNALAIMLASLALLGLGIFGPGIASGLVSGAPQLGAGAAAGTALAAGGLVFAGGAAAVGAARVGGSVGAAAWRRASTALRRGGPGSPPPPTGGAGPASGAPPGNSPAGTAGEGGSPSATAPSDGPNWAQRLRSRFTRAGRNATHAARSAERPTNAPHPDLDQEEKKDE